MGDVNIRAVGEHRAAVTGVARLRCLHYRERLGEACLLAELGALDLRDAGGSWAAGA